MSTDPSTTPLSKWLPGLLQKLVSGVLLTLVAGALVMFLWNAIVPQAIDGAHPVSFFGAVGLLLLSRILFYSGWLTPGQLSSRLARRVLPEEDRAAFLSRVRQRLAEAEVERTGDWGPGNREG